MINLAKQIDYWRSTSEQDIETASILVGVKKHLEGLFFCHLSIEKIIKALVVKETENIPPRSHDLFYLARIAKINFTETQSEFMEILMRYQLEGRYPEYYPSVPPIEKINEYLYDTKMLQLCFKAML